MSTPGIVAVAVTDGMPMLEMSIAAQVFGIQRRDIADPWYELRMCAADPGETRIAHGFVLDTPYDLHALHDADIVIVPGLNPENIAADIVDHRLNTALLAAHARGARIVSLCTGAFALAAAGLLDGRPATTHWRYADLMRTRYPRVLLDPSVLYVDDGDVLTSAGVTAGIDLCLHLVRTDLGADIANQVARRMVVQTHRAGGQAQFIEQPMPRSDSDGFGQVLQWATKNLDQQLTVTQLARTAGLSTRTLARRFTESTGTTPLRWLHSARLSRARQLLESTDLPVERISQLCGMGTAGNLRHHFTREVGVTPMTYRRSFQR
ncbi:helix-turn-helix domain-containing protein [Nocardia yamanashiensis]|uniref:helix-turn-helix domain-containing protein n=1 Tax=Nocardia yamanashiensis TaxID=209247 RepID=UPI001E29FC80|nr:helix-turn-helix domain-containing protein [Nocardia yamanashiensis]UGT43941.1 helix-turn-helix domain-containing protein [Nocardia yamanashiensis]